MNLKNKILRVFPDYGPCTGVWNQIKHDPKEDYVISYKDLRKAGVSKFTIHMLKVMQDVYNIEDSGKFRDEADVYLDYLGRKIVEHLELEGISCAWIGA